MAWVRLQLSATHARLSAAVAGWERTMAWAGNIWVAVPSAEQVPGLHRAEATGPWCRVKGLLHPHRAPAGPALPQTAMAAFHPTLPASVHRELVEGMPEPGEEWRFRGASVTCKMTTVATTRTARPHTRSVTGGGDEGLLLARRPRLFLLADSGCYSY